MKNQDLLANRIDTANGQIMADASPVKLSKMETVAYAMPNEALSDLLAQMRKLEGAVVKREGTTATVRLVVGEKSKTMLMAMQHSNRRVWLVRAIAGLVEVKGE